MNKAVIIALDFKTLKRQKHLSINLKNRYMLKLGWSCFMPKVLKLLII